MAAKSSSTALFILWVSLLSCSPKDPLPIDIWSKGCIQLAPDSVGFRLSGMCCAYLILPPLSFDSNHQFSLKGEYFAFTGAGYASQSIRVNGELSPDGQTLTISYLTGTALTTHQLKPGAATMFCFCGCN